MAPYFSRSNATDYDFTLQKSRAVTTRERRDKALVCFMYLLKWISRIYIYIAKLFCIDNDTRGPRAINRILVLKYQPLCPSRYASIWLFTPENGQNIRPLEILFII